MRKRENGENSIEQQVHEDFMLVCVQHVHISPIGLQNFYNSTKISHQKEKMKKKLIIVFKYSKNATV